MPRGLIMIRGKEETMVATQVATNVVETGCIPGRLARLACRPFLFLRRRLAAFMVGAVLSAIASGG